MSEGGRNGRGERGNGQRGTASVRRILVVEDEAMICVETADTLEQQGFVVHVALSAEDGLHRLRGGLAIDILFTDINLAGPMTGETLALLARELMPGVTVVYTSGTVAAPSKRVEGSRFVPKPYSPEWVARMLEQMRPLHA